MIAFIKPQQLAAAFSGICNLIVVFHAVKSVRVFINKTCNLDNCRNCLIEQVSLLSFTLLTVSVGS